MSPAALVIAAAEPFSPANAWLRKSSIKEHVKQLIKIGVKLSTQYGINHNIWWHHILPHLV